MELEEFALGESALGSASAVEEASGGISGGGRGLKAAASTAASNLRRNVRTMLQVQQQQHQQLQQEVSRRGSADPLCRYFVAVGECNAKLRVEIIFWRRRVEP